jgi:hypothetical protein
VVTAEPEGDVYVDGKKVGRAPLTQPVSRGTHDVRLRDPGRGIDVRRKVSVKGPATPVKFTVGKGKLDVTAPGDADVYWFRADNLRGQGVTVSVNTAGLSLLVPRLEVLDAAGNVVASGVGGGPGAGDVSLHLTGLHEGSQYFARVTAGAD